MLKSHVLVVIYLSKIVLVECSVDFILNFIRYTHIEAECPFINFDDLLDRIEDLIVDVVDRVLKHPEAHLLYEINPDFKAPKKPFRRMNYSDGLQWLQENGVKNEETGDFYKFGEDIPEMPERQMTDKINEPILFCRFPAEIKSFYMKRDQKDTRLTESVCYSGIQFSSHVEYKF